MGRAKVMLFSHICGSSFITGAEKYLLRLTGELSRHFDCILVVPDEGVLLQEAKQQGIQTVVHPIPLVWSLFNPEMSSPQELEGKLRRNEHGAILNLLHMHQPDLVIVNTVVNPIPAAAAKVLSIPVAWCITEKIAEQADRAFSVRWIDQHADWIIGISESTLQPFRKVGLEGKLYLLPPTWQMEELQPDMWPYYRLLRRSELGLTPEQRVVGYISSSLHPEKGLEHFLHMALKLCPGTPDVHFLIVGNTTQKQYVERCETRISQSGYASRFHRLAFEPRIERLYPAMDYVVIPSLIEEGFGMTALEGLVFGKSVIAYRAGGLDEILRTTGHASGLVEKGNADALTLKMLEKLEAPMTETEQEASRREADAAFGIEAYRKRLLRLVSLFQTKSSSAATEPNSSPLPPLLTNALYKSEAAAAVFLIENGVKRPFASPEAFRFFKYRWSDIHPVTDAVLHRFPTSAVVSMEAPFHRHRPSVMLAKGRGPTVYLLTADRRFPFVSMRSIRQRGFRPESIVTIPDDELVKLGVGEPLEELAHDNSPAKRGRKRKRRLTGGRGTLRKAGKPKRVRRSKRGSRKLTGRSSKRRPKAGKRKRAAA
ncbi:glycosyltransferase [Paenibacillus rigui]|uniref:Uncharacterized protein n=1 Tax=Paenibacillus rigui TaxID=554312 RepID=A0A229UJE7_9BACL|nr:glycosyltransferase [Paenibacillus rigui]OXM83481.1 hypothetical protein CF651_25505 [Paenibacillus rigui]